MFDTGTTTFMFLATSLVMLMTPGLAFFYGGLGSKRDVLNIMIQSFVSMGISSILWFTMGYSLCFSGNMASGNDFFGILGNLDKVFFNGITPSTLYLDANGVSKGFPEYLFIAYQMMFAIITPALITGAFINRVSFRSYVFFLILWQIFVYYPFVHMVWGGGLLAEWGVIDFAGGIAVHATAGFAALASVYFVGKRKKKTDPNNVPLVAVGTALLWFGWYGFNAGSELAVDSITVSAFLNTDIAASFAAITWLVIEWTTGNKRPTFIGLMTGAVAGLATITPAAGYVNIYGAVTIGIIAGAGCYLAVKWKDKKGWDDALDVWGVHGMGGVIGTICVGLFATKAINGGVEDGLFYGGGVLLLVKQTVAILIAIIYAFFFTLGLFKIINKFIPVRVTEAEQELGLDMSLHGEVARQ
ncbi:MAG: ammonium transporter [Paludibacteraceae bacterium]|nr:ammonium transporter [Paludibacteraceae bacterium]